MVDHVSHNTAFAQGMQKQLVKCARALMHKTALNPRIPEQIMYDARRAPVLAALGKSVFNRSYKQPNPLLGMLMTGVAGYRQLRGVHEARATHITELSGLRKGLQSFAPGSAEHNSLAQYIADKRMAFKSEMKQRMIELGARAEPRLNFATKTLPAIGAGAVGIGGGAMIGNVTGTTNEQNDVSGAPFASRLNYLLHPYQLPTTPPVPPTLGATDPSATDSGGV
jgi:hypothetical protein